jgi:hypothetical protein
MIDLRVQGENRAGADDHPNRDARSAARRQTSTDVLVIDHVERLTDR